jgi:hypothetical protein
MQNLPKSLIKSTICSDAEGLDFMLSSGFDVRMIRLAGNIFSDTDALERYVEFGGALTKVDFDSALSHATYAKNLIRIISLLPPNMFDESENYESACYSWERNLLSTESFKNWIVKIVAACRIADKLLVFNFMFDIFNKDQINNDDSPSFLMDFVFYCFLRCNHPIAKDLIAFIVNKFDNNVSNLIMSYIIKFYSYDPTYRKLPWDFMFWPDVVLANVLESLDLQLDKQIMVNSLFCLPLAATQHFHKIGFDYANTELIPCGTSDYGTNVKIEIIKYLHEIGVNFMLETNAKLIDYSSEEQVTWFVETVCKSERELVRQHKCLLEDKHYAIKSSLWIKIKNTYLSD